MAGQLKTVVFRLPRLYVEGIMNQAGVGILPVEDALELFLLFDAEGALLR